MTAPFPVVAVSCQRLHECRHCGYAESRPRGGRMTTITRPAEARAATAATVTMTAAVVLLVSALGLYHWAGASSDLILRDVVLATLLGLCAVGNLVAPTRAGRSAVGVL